MICTGNRAHLTRRTPRNIPRRNISAKRSRSVNVTANEKEVISSALIFGAPSRSSLVLMKCCMICFTFSSTSALSQFSTQLLIHTSGSLTFMRDSFQGRYFLQKCMVQLFASEQNKQNIFTFTSDLSSGFRGWLMLAARRQTANREEKLCL
jgi:hypothetical protein